MMMNNYYVCNKKYISRSPEFPLNLYCEGILEGFKSNTKNNVTLIIYPQNGLWLQRKNGFTSAYSDDQHKQMRPLNLDV